MTLQADGPAFDMSVPNAARIYDYFLGGKDNFVADRNAAAKLLMVLPGSAQACRANRDFLQRAVRYLSGAGIRQFLDIGSGLPTAGNTHEVAHEAVTVIPGDLRKPGDILAHPDLTALINFSQPVAVLLVAVLHFLTGDDSPATPSRSSGDA